MQVDQVRRTQDGLTLKAYRGDGSAMLAFDVDERLVTDLAGFAVECRSPRGKNHYLQNWLNFAQAITAATTPEHRSPAVEGQAPAVNYEEVRA
jgi:hypothetical protein